MTYTGKNHSGGKNWPLYLMEFNNIKLWNYAVGGAVINKKYLKNNNKNNIDLEKQYEYFHENMSEGKQFYNVWNKDNSLFTFWFGACDIGYRKYGSIDEVTDNLFNIINKIYEVGARNILIFGSPPIYRNPYRSIFYKNKGCSKKDCNYIKNEVLTFNYNVVNKMKMFFEKYSDTNMFFYSTVEKFEEIIFKCKKYGFKDCINAWGYNKQKNINDYFWANSHISFKANKYLANDINEFLRSLNK